MNKITHATAVALLPPTEVWEPIQTIRKQYDRQFRRWMPHINLVYPFYPREEFAQLATQFVQVGEAMTPFTVELKEFQYFEHGRGGYTLWLAPEPKAKLIELQEALAKVVPDCDEASKHGFTPHLSVGQCGTKEEVLRLQSSFQASWRAVSFCALEVSLIWRGEPPHDIFQVDRTARLGK